MKEKICIIEGCGIKRYGRRLCSKHYTSHMRAGTLNSFPRIRGTGSRFIAHGTPCSVALCNSPVSGRGWCKKHYMRWYKHGDPSVKLIADKRDDGGWLTSSGYVECFRPEHPNATANGRILMHRLAMSEKLGRSLYGNENVHHINGLRDDNRIENLELWTTMQPTGKRSEELVEYAREILQRYGTITEKIVVSSVGKAGYKAYSNPWITNKMMGDFIGEIEDDLKPRLRLVDGDL